MSGAIRSGHNGVLTLRAGTGTAREHRGDVSHEGVAEEGTEHPWDPSELAGPQPCRPSPALPCRTRPAPRALRRGHALILPAMTTKAQMTVPTHTPPHKARRSRTELAAAPGPAPLGKSSLESLTAGFVIPKHNGPLMIITGFPAALLFRGAGAFLVPVGAV